MDRDEDGILEKDGKSFVFQTIIIEGDNEMNDIVLLIQKDLAQIGVRMDIKTVLITDLNEKYLFRKNFDAVLIFIHSGLHPDVSYKTWHSSQIDAGLNVFSYKNQEVDKYLEQGRMALNQEEAKKYYFQFQEEMFNDPPGIFLFWKEYRYPINKRLRGVGVTQFGMFSSIPNWWVPKDEQKYHKPPE